MSGGEKNIQPGSRQWKNLGLRVVSALIMAAICLLPFYFGGAAWAFLILIIGLRVIWEWVRMTDPQRSQWALIIPMIGLIITLTYAYSGDYLFALICIFVTASWALLERYRRGSISGFIWAAFGVLYIFAPCVAMIALRGNEAGWSAAGFRLVLYLILVVVAADTGAYFGGSYFGGPKLVPRLSPKKTWSGLFSGLLAGIVVGALCAGFLKTGPVFSATLAVPIVVLSVCGDFLESAVKRALHVKDAGGLLPGHGGLLDRVDSLMLTAFVIALVQLVWPLKDIV